MKNKLVWVGASLAALLVFQLSYGFHTVETGNISWLMTVRHDWGTHYLGWSFFRNEPWQFPLGHVRNYFYPLGTNVGFTDSIPLFAIFFKLFAGFLPQNFQYFGIWLLLCHLLAVWYSILLLNRFKLHPFFIFAGAVLIAANPVLLYRGLHPALCGQFLFVASLYLYFLRPEERSQRYILNYQLALLVLSALINPYLCFMVLGFSLVIPLRMLSDKLISRKRLLVYLAASVFALLFTWYLIGMIEFGKKEDLGVSGGFGLYGMNLNSLFNPSGYSALLPQLMQVSWHQYEGFMYLGLGIMLLFAIVLVLRLTRPVASSSKRIAVMEYRVNGIRAWPLLLVLLLFSLFAVTHVLSFGQHVLFRVPVPKFILKFGEIFRASARFFWVPYYVIFYALIVKLARAPIRVTVKEIIVCVVVLLQFYDCWPLLTHWRLSYGDYHPPISEEKWNHLFGETDQLVFFPPFQANNLVNMDYQDFSFLAARQRKPINTGYVARQDNRAMKIYSDSLIYALQAGELAANRVYVSSPLSLENYPLLLQDSGIAVNLLDGYYYFFKKEGTASSLQQFAARENRIHLKTLDSLASKSGQKNFFLATARQDTGNIRVQSWIERLNYNRRFLSSDGWAFIDNTANNKGDSIFLTLQNDSNFYSGATRMVQRPDLTDHFKRTYLADGGFNTILFLDSVKPATYQVGFTIRNSNGRQVHMVTQRFLTIGLPDFGSPTLISTLPAPEPIIFNVDGFDVANGMLSINGWAAFEKQDADRSNINIFFSNGKQIFACPAASVDRPDISAAKGRQFKFDHAGFALKIKLSSLPPGVYKIGAIVHDNATHKKGSVAFGNTIKIQ